MVLDY